MSRPLSLFETLLPPEKKEALARGENITVTGEEAKRFAEAFESLHREVTRLRKLTGQGPFKPRTSRKREAPPPISPEMLQQIIKLRDEDHETFAAIGSVLNLAEHRVSVAYKLAREGNEWKLRVSDRIRTETHPMNVKIDELNLTVRTVNELRNAGIRTVSDLLQANPASLLVPASKVSGREIQKVIALLQEALGSPP